MMTHYHRDHCTFLPSLPGTEVWATAQDAPALELLETLISRYGLLGSEWEASTRKLILEELQFRPTKVTRIVSEGEELRFGKTRAVAVVAPGHTPGHLCLHFPDDGILFLGDYDLSAFGPWYGDTPGCIDAFRRSARRLAGICAERYVVSHEEPVHLGPITGKMEAYLSVIDRREKVLRDYLQEPRTRSEIIALRAVYGPARDGPMFDCWEWVLVSEHLKGMIGRGEIRLDEGKYRMSHC